MLGALRLINPPGHGTRKKPFPKYAATAPRAKAPAKRRKAAAKPAAAPAKRKAAPAKRTASGRFVAAPKRLAPARRRSTTAKPRNRWGRFVAASKRVGSAIARGARVVARGAKRVHKKSRAAYRAWKRNPQTGVVTVAVKKHKKAKKAAPKKHKKAKKAAPRKSAKRVAAAKKAVATKARKHAKRVAAAKKGAKTRARKHVKTAARKSTTTKRRRRRGAPGKRLIAFTMRPRRGAPRRSYTLRKVRVKGKKGQRPFNTARVYRNPATAMKSMLMDGVMLYGGLVGMRVINGLLKQYVVDKALASNASLATVLPVLPAAAGFALAALAPKVIKGKDKLLHGLQVGATIALLDAVMNTFVKPALPANVRALLGGIDDMGIQGYGYGLSEYIPQTRQLGAYGVEANEAMALDEYVTEPMGSFDVSEALVDSEVQGMKSGYAEGLFTKTIFGS